VKKGDNIEELFKEAFDNYQVDPGDQLWSKIQSEIPSAESAISNASASSTAGKSAVVSKVGGSWLSAAAVGGVIIATTIAGYYYFENKAKDLRTTKETKAQEELIERVEQPLEDIETSSQEEKEIQFTETDTEVNKEEKSKKNLEVTEKVKEKAPTTLAEEAESGSNSEETTSKNLDTTIESVEDDSKDGLSSEKIDQKEAEQVESELIQAEQATTSAGNIQPKDQIEVVEDPKSDLQPSDPNRLPSSDPIEKEENPYAAIEQFKLMNVFSPNGDGVNDVFTINPDSIDAMGIEAVEVKIFSPSGKIIHQWRDKYGSWNGLTSSGVKANEGVYMVQTILTKDGKKFPKTSTLNLVK
jgi:gliding motility-associated-like protein